MNISKASDESLDRGFPDVIRLSLSSLFFFGGFSVINCRVNTCSYQGSFCWNVTTPMFVVFMVLNDASNQLFDLFERVQPSKNP